MQYSRIIQMAHQALHEIGNGGIGKEEGTIPNTSDRLIYRFTRRSNDRVIR